MTEEDKELLLRDLSARLPYGVRVFVSGDDFDNYQYPYLLTAISKFGQDIFCKIYSPIYTPLGCPGIENVKPYLFPLSSITDEQKSELNKKFNVQFSGNDIYSIHYHSEGCWDTDLELDLQDWLWFINWCYKNHFDIYGLIPKGLALDATNLNIY